MSLTLFFLDVAVNARAMNNISDEDISMLKHRFVDVDDLVLGVNDSDAEAVVVIPGISGISATASSKHHRSRDDDAGVREKSQDYDWDAEEEVLRRQAEATKRQMQQLQKKRNALQVSFCMHSISLSHAQHSRFLSFSFTSQPVQET